MERKRKKYNIQRRVCRGEISDNRYQVCVAMQVRCAYTSKEGTAGTVAGGGDGEE